MFQPCLPTPRRRAPSGPAWVHEIKHDGYRLLVRRDGDRIALYTRRGFNWRHRFPLIVQAVPRLKVRSVMVDGEAVVCAEDGRSDFDKLHSQGCDDQVVLYAFDLIELNGEDLRREPLEVRKATLASVLGKAGGGLRFNEHIAADGPTVFAHACRMGLEGIVSKRRDLPYQSGRSKCWVKVKNRRARRCCVSRTGHGEQYRCCSFVPEHPILHVAP
jgi:bifunctional non-homologous end joining protein LigD